MAFHRYKIKEHFLSFNPRYTITDDREQLVGTVNKHAFSPRKRATLYNDLEEEVSEIYKKLFSFQRTYFIHKDGIPHFRIFKTFGIKPRIYVESLTQPEAFYIQGDIWSSEYAFYRENKEFAFVSRKIWKIRDAYLAAVEEEEDQYLILSVIIVLDFLRKSRKSS